jgi:hypothetical protein
MCTTTLAPSSLQKAQDEVQLYGLHDEKGLATTINEEGSLGANGQLAQGHHKKCPVRGILIIKGSEQ